MNRLEHKQMMDRMAALERELKAAIERIAALEAARQPALANKASRELRPAS